LTTGYDVNIVAIHSLYLLRVPDILTRLAALQCNGVAFGVYEDGKNKISGSGDDSVARYGNLWLKSYEILQLDEYNFQTVDWKDACNSNTMFSITSSVSCSNPTTTWSAKGVTTTARNMLKLPFLLYNLVPVYSNNMNNACNKSAMKFTQELLVGIFSGTVTFWNDSLIASLNPQCNFTAGGVIHLVVPSHSSTYVQHRLRT
jgi:hypothetical protein